MLYKNEKPAILMLQDGRYFQGIGFGAIKIVTGELVFNTVTGCGYNEVLTDPSYQGQIVVMTHPLVGNYGVPPWEKDEVGITKYFESDSIKVTGFIVNECCKHPSHYESVKTLDQFLQEQDVPGIEWTDTRAITKILREEGVQIGLLAVYDQGQKPDIQYLKEIVKEATDPNLRHLASEVSTKQVIKYIPPNPLGKVVVLDMGVKLNILRNFVERGLELIVVPHNYAYEQIMEFKPNGVFVSNGPGDPAMCKSAIKTCKDLNNLDTFLSSLLAYSLSSILKILTKSLVSLFVILHLVGKPHPDRDGSSRFGKNDLPKTAGNSSQPTRCISAVMAI